MKRMTSQTKTGFWPRSSTLGGSSLLTSNDVILAWINTKWFAITDQSHQIEVEWEASELVGPHTGQLKLFIDSVQKANLTGIDNDTFRIDQVRLGAVGGIDTTPRGEYFLDLFESFHK
jgi:hypothetical protein